MGIFDRFKGFFNRVQEPQEKAVAGAAAEAEGYARKIFGDAGLGRYSSSLSQNTDRLIQVYREVPELRAIVHKIATNLASTSWYVSRIARKSDGKSILNIQYSLASQANKSVIKSRLKDAEVVEIFDDPLINFLYSGNSMLNGFEVWQILHTHFELVGESVAIIDRNGMGMPVGLWPIPPYWITSIPSVDDPMFRVKVMGREVLVPEEDVLYLRDPDPYDPYKRGSGIAAALGEEIDTNEYISGFIKHFFLNDATPSSIIAFPECQSDAEMKRAKEIWLAAHKGQNRAHSPAFYSQEPKIHTFDTKFKDYQMAELREAFRAIIRETWGVPPEILGKVDNSNRATIDAAEYIFARWVILPRLERLRIDLQNQVVPMFDDRKILEYVSPIPDDKDYALAASTAQPHTRTVNEWRSLQGLAPRQDGDVYMLPFGLVPEPAGPELGPGKVAKKATSVAKKATQKNLTQPQVESLVAIIDPLPMELELDWWEDEMERAGKKYAGEYSDTSQFDMNRPEVVAHIKKFQKDTMKDISRTTQWRLRKELARGIEAGDSIDEIAARLETRFRSVNQTRAKIIAQTEVAKSLNFANWEAQKQSGVAKREWVALLDSRTRSDHAGLDTVQASINEPFVFPSGGTTMAPGMSGIPEQDINCRCTTIPVLEKETVAGDYADLEEERSARETRRKDAADNFDREFDKWESRAVDSFENAFEIQLLTVLDKLDQLAR